MSLVNVMPVTTGVVGSTPLEAGYRYCHTEPAVTVCTDSTPNRSV